MRLLLLAAAVLLPASAAAQKPDDIVKWTAKGPEGAVKPGGTGTVELSAKIEEGWVLYALTQPANGPIALEVAVAKGQPFAVDAKKIEAPLPASKKTDVGSENYYESQVKLGVPLVAAREIKAGDHTLPLEVTYQVCSGSICLRPHTETLAISISVKK